MNVGNIDKVKPLLFKQQSKDQEIDVILELFILLNLQIVDLVVFDGKIVFLNERKVEIVLFVR